MAGHPGGGRRLHGNGPDPDLFLKGTQRKDAGVESSLYTFAEDLRAEGTEQVLDRVLGYGCDGLTVAAAYHRARDVTPHGPARVTLRRDGVHFVPPPDLFDGL